MVDDCLRLIDVLVGNNGEAPLLLSNSAGKGNHWLGGTLEIPLYYQN
jgi:hypothetical protein